MRRLPWLAVAGWCLIVVPRGPAEPPAPVQLADYFPPPEAKGGWRSLVTENQAPTAEQKTKIRELAGVDWDKLAAAWEHNLTGDGRSSLFVIRRGYVVGEWYQGCKRSGPFNVYSSSKAYTSVACGLLLADSEAGKLPGGKKLTLDTKVFTADWLPEALPLTDPRKAEITLRHLLNMESGLGIEPVPGKAPFEWSLGKVAGSPMEKLAADPGTKFRYSNAGVAHLVLLCKRAAGKDLYPFLKERLFDPIGMDHVTWDPIGGDGHLGPLSQGYSGIRTSAREHARFCHLALHRGNWAGKPIVPAGYYEFAWQPTKTNPTYGAQWWVYPHHPDAPRDLVQTAGAYNNHGYVVPSLDLVIVRLGDGKKYPAKFSQDLVKKVLAAVVP